MVNAAKPLAAMLFAFKRPFSEPTPAFRRILVQQMHTERTQMILAALPPLAIPVLERVVRAYAAFVPVHSLSGAKALLQSDPDISLIVCGMHFDESRMFDLLRYARDVFPHLPFVCCRVLAMQLPQTSMQTIGTTAASLGAVTFFDLAGRENEVGKATAEQEFRNVILGYLPPAPDGGG
jgi:hypothetical protein